MKILITEKQLREIQIINHSDSKGFGDRALDFHLKNLGKEIWGDRDKLYLNNDGTYSYIMYNENIPIAGIKVYMKDDVIHIKSAPAVRGNYQGKKIGSLLYDNLTRLLKLPIVGQTTQTNQSRFGIWGTLEAQYPNRIFGYNIKTKERTKLSLNDIYSSEEDIVPMLIP